MKGGPRLWLSRKHADDAVAEIVGAILIFAVVITLFTSFMVWYVPNATAGNENHYELSTGSSIGNLVAQMHDGNFYTGSSFSESIPLGISGIPVISAPQDTEFSVLPSSAEFNASLSFNVTVIGANSTGSLSTHYFNEHYTAKGILSTNGNTEYITPINYVVQDGASFQNYGSGQPSVALGPMPLGISSNGTSVGLQLEIFGMKGASVTYSASQSQVVNFVTNYSQSYTFANGTTGAISGKQYLIQSMTLNYLNYTFNGPLEKAWDYGMFGTFNSTQLSYDQVAGLSNWNFSGYSMKALSSGSSLYITNTGAMKLSSISTEAIYLSVS